MVLTLVVHVHLRHGRVHGVAEHRVSLEITGLGGSVVTAAVDTVGVLGGELAEGSELSIRDGEDHIGDNLDDIIDTGRLGVGTVHGNERFFAHLELLGEKAVVSSFTRVTLQVLSSVGIENGSNEWVVHGTAGHTIEQDHQDHELASGGVTESVMELKVVVLTEVGMLRGSVPMATQVLGVVSLAKRIGGVEEQAGGGGPVGGDGIRNATIAIEGVDSHGEIGLSGSSGIILSR